MERNLLKRLTLLYVEDDNSIRTELGSLLENFFGKVYTAPNGLEGLEFFMQNKNSIDIILADINMPKMNGIEMVKNIRAANVNVPVIFATAYSDNDFLFEAVKLHVYDYIVKPIDIRQALTLMSDLASTIYQEFLIKQQNIELERYKKAIDQNNIVIKTDLNRHITYVNEQFCVITGYDKNELIGRTFDCVKHKDTDISLIDDMFNNVFENNSWQGKIKNQTKSGDGYIVDCYCIASLNESGDITGTISIQRDITLEINQTRLLKKALIKDKGEIILKQKETNAELNSVISELQNEVSTLQRVLRTTDLEKQKLNYSFDKLTSENNRLSNELNLMMKNSSMMMQKATTAFRMNKDNGDLKTEVKNLLKQKDDLEHKLSNIRATFEPRIRELEAENKKFIEQIESAEDVAILTQKLEHWRDKSKESFRRIEQLEQEVLRIADEDTMNRLFR